MMIHGGVDADYNLVLASKDGLWIAISNPDYTNLVQKEGAVLAMSLARSYSR